jgi:aminopeptidase-like protein
MTTVVDLAAAVDAAAAGRELHALATELFPIPRSLTGEGVRETLRLLGKRIPLTVHEVPTGTRAFDWTVPREWNLRDAWVANARGERVIDVRRSNLHVVGGSVPVRRRMSLDELRPHLHTLPDHPEWIPFRTAYYSETWGFCLAHRDYLRLTPGEYEVVIDASLEDGSLTYGECLLEGEGPDEVLVSTHVCHPSLANDNASGLALATLLAECLATVRRRYSYRFVFVPGTIGSLTWLSRNETRLGRIRHGLVVVCAGDPGPFSYKKTRRGDTELDRAALHVLRHAGVAHEVVDFFPWGYDERQYSSPGFDLPVGSLSRTPHGRYPQYHTSADDLTFVTPQALGDSLVRYLEILEVLEGNAIYRNLCSKGEPQLGRRGLWRPIGGQAAGSELALLWVLNFSDGRASLLDIAERAGLPFRVIRRAADALCAHGLLAEAGPAPRRAAA